MNALQCHCHSVATILLPSELSTTLCEKNVCVTKMRQLATTKTITQITTLILDCVTEFSFCNLHILTVRCKCLSTCMSNRQTKIDKCDIDSLTRFGSDNPGTSAGSKSLLLGHYICDSAFGFCQLQLPFPITLTPTAL